MPFVGVAQLCGESGEAVGDHGVHPKYRAWLGDRGVVLILVVCVIVVHEGVNGMLCAVHGERALEADVRCEPR